MDNLNTIQLVLFSILLIVLVLGIILIGVLVYYIHILKGYINHKPKPVPQPTESPQVNVDIRGSVSIKLNGVSVTNEELVDALGLSGDDARNMHEICFAAATYTTTYRPLQLEVMWKNIAANIKQCAEIEIDGVRFYIYLWRQWQPPFKAITTTITDRYVHEAS